MATVFKPKGRVKYVIQYFDENGRRRKAPGCIDKAESERIANNLENQVALRRAGLIDRKAEAYRDHEARPLADHLADFKAALLAKGGTKKHAQVTEYRARRVVELAKAKRITDLSLSKALDALAVLRGEGLGQETINHHIRAVKGFSRWLWRDGRAREHYLAHLPTANPEPDRRYRRRPLTPEEAITLVNMTETGPRVMGMTGPDRGILYALTMGTGLRSAELRTLTPERFDLSADQPAVTVLACYSKNGREAVQPLAAALADRLAPWIASKPAGRPVFEGMTKRTAEMLAIDLKAAGIEPETASGVVDFHALRGTYISHLVSSGASVKTCQTLARHSTPSLTIGIYAKASLHDIRGAVETLPDLTPTAPRNEALAATGTEGNSLPTAPQSATHPLAIVTHGVDLQAPYGMSPEDLKSSPGEPGCGFDCHRRYSESSLANPPGLWMLPHKTAPHFDPSGEQRGYTD